MPRKKRADEGGAIYHVLNRGNARQALFHKPEDFDAFERVLAEGLDRYAVSLFCYTLMPNHWHLVLRPIEDGQLGRFLRWVTATHTLRLHVHYDTVGEGHLYQARFKSFPVSSDEHFLTVCRYVERNPLRANLVDRAERWRYGSLWRWLQSADPAPQLLTPWPIPRPSQWVARVNQPMNERELDAIRTCVQRGRPFGDDDWVQNEVQRLGLTHTIRPHGRPTKRGGNRDAEHG